MVSCSLLALLLVREDVVHRRHGAKSIVVDSRVMFKMGVVACPCKDGMRFVGVSLKGVENG